MGRVWKAGKDAVADMQTDYFFTVGVGPSGNYKNFTDFANSAVKAGKHASYAGTTLANLNKAFDDIQKQITELACTNVTISDPLSENVEMVKGQMEMSLHHRCRSLTHLETRLMQQILELRLLTILHQNPLKCNFRQTINCRKAIPMRSLPRSSRQKRHMKNTEHQATQIRQMQEPEHMQEAPDSIRTKMNMQY